MRIRTAGAALLALALSTISCSEGIVAPATTADPGAPRLTLAASSLPEVRISEIHYDNAGTDAGEAIEVSGPAGTSLAGWSLVLYNGNGGVTYGTRTFTAADGVIPGTCGARGVLVQSYPSNGIQNGDPTDGVALVNAAGQVVEFLAYEGPMTATNGPAAGMAATVMEASEPSGAPVGSSLQRNSAGVWSGPSANSFGACNDDQPIPVAEVASVTVTPVAVTLAPGGTQALAAVALSAAGPAVPGVPFTWSSADAAVATVDAAGVVTAVAVGEARVTATAPNGVAGSAVVTVGTAQPPVAGDAFISEIHYDNEGADVGEAIEIEGPAGLSLVGWSVVLYNGSGGAPYGSPIALSGQIQGSCGDRGVLHLEVPGLQNGDPDGVALLSGVTVVDFISYDGSFTATSGPATGMMAKDVGVKESNSSTAIGRSLQRARSGEWFGPRIATFGACNPATPPAPTFGISFTGRTPGDAALPVGFQDQLFATLRDDNGATVATTFSWTAVTPNVAVDGNGVITALAPGDATIRATAADGVTTATYTLPFRVAAASATARYAGNAEFGEPKDADASDDFIVRHPQFTSSYSSARNTPNWVSYNLEATHFGDEDRCDCFSFDPELPASYSRYTTADYTGAGAFHGYGIDRGHLARSFDRTAGSADNAATFLFSNIIPQAADLNQGPWALMENDLGDRARVQNREVYIVTGVAGSRGTLKDEGKITIPDAVWKVAVIMPRDEGLEDVRDRRDVEVIAVVMPNRAGVRNVPWSSYRTTVDAVETLSGYDLLALLPDQVEIAVESGTEPPRAVLDGPYAVTEGGTVEMSAAASTDPDGDALTYAWSFGDGSTATGASVSHRYPQDGSYPVLLTVTDSRGLTATAASTATVANAPPEISALVGATLLPGETYAGSGSFTDPGADGWRATVDYGDGAPAQTLALAGASFSLSHRYTTAGAYTVTVTVSDDDVSSLRMATVVVQTPVQAVDEALSLVARLGGAGTAASGGSNSEVNWRSVSSKLEAARASLQRGNANAASGQLGAARNELAAIVQSGRAAAATVEPVDTLVARVIRSISAG